ncbi:MAG: hypothetical protein ACFE0Q_10940 [Anaerolineae bacterium]
MHRIIIIIYLFALMFSITHAQDAPPTVPDVIGQTVPRAEATLNAEGYRLNPLIRIVTATEGLTPDTVQAVSTPDAENRVQVTVARVPNVELIWDNSDSFAETNFLANRDPNDLFTLVNLSDEILSLRNVQIGNLSASAWGTELRALNCVQIWTFNESNGFTLPECGSIQGGGILNRLNRADQFWLEPQFDVYQNGIHRGRCERDAGRCSVWLSPAPIAQDLTPYLYLIYDTNEFIIFNNSDAQWMDFASVTLPDVPPLSDASFWDGARIPDLQRLAPGQCVRLALAPDADELITCDAIATVSIVALDIFWRERFTINDMLNGERQHECPPALSGRTLCLFER